MVLVCLIFFDSHLQTSAEKERGQLGCTGRNRAQMQSVAVGMGCSLVTWNKHLNLWITRFTLFDKHRQQLHHRCIFLSSYLILSKNVVHTHTHVWAHAQFCAFWKHVGVWLTGHRSFWGSCFFLTLFFSFFSLSFPFWSWLQEQIVTNNT